jgi:SAM-dependent methyltransferase
MDVQELIRRIRAEAARNAPAAEAVGMNAPGMAATWHAEIPRVAEGASALPMQPRYDVRDFLAYHDADFVRSAYRGLLRREPDATGSEHYLAALRSARLSKIDILGRIRYSAEGRAAGVHVRGLAAPFAVRSLRRVPLLGRVVAIVQYVWRLPDLVRNHERLETVLFQREAELRAQLNGQARAIQTTFDTLHQRLAATIAESQQRVSVLEAREPDVRQQLQRLVQAGSDVSDRVSTLDAAVRAEADATRGRLATMQQAMDALHSLKVERHEVDVLRTTVLSRLDAETTRAAELRAETERALGGFRDRLLDQWRSHLEHERRVNALLDEVRQRGAMIAPTPAAPVTSEYEAHALDAFYVAFEDRFRGARADILKRAAVYLPVVQAAQAGTSEAPVLDLGCGRGEWLETLRDSGLTGRGVDRNAAMVDACRELGLDAIAADALAYLRSLPDGSVGAVTAMHIVEHVPFQQVIVMLDEILRVLKPGGVAIFETPNPENVYVGACNFYIDPTHLHPYPPDALRFVFESRGFAEAVVRRLRIEPDGSRFLQDAPTNGDDPMLRLFTETLDYCVVATK